MSAGLALERMPGGVLQGVFPADFVRDTYQIGRPERLSARGDWQHTRPTPLPDSGCKLLYLKYLSGLIRLQKWKRLDGRACCLRGFRTL